MSKASFGILIAVTLIAGPAATQPGADHSLRPAAAEPDAAVGKPAKPVPTVSGIVVEGVPKKPCAPRDKDCIALVMAEVKALYPEQLKRFCAVQQMDVMRQDMQANIAGWCDGPGLGASSMCSHYVSPVVKQVCAPDKK